LLSALLEMDKIKALQSALSARNDEVEGYQIDIDNFERAIAKINTEHLENSAMVEFRDRLAEMLVSNKTEQLKAKIIRDVIADQLSELEAP